MKILRPFLLALGVTAGSAALLLLLLAFIFGKTRTLPQEMIPLLTILVGCAAVFGGSFLAAMAAKENGMLIGLGTGGAAVLILAAVSLLALGGEFSLASVWKAAALLLSGALGGVLGVNRKSRVKF